MNRGGMLLVALMIAGVLPTAPGCASRQRGASAAQAAKADPPASAPSADAGANPAGQSSVDPPAAQPEVMGAASADEDLAETDILAAQGEPAPSGSVVGRAIRAAPGVAEDTVLFPFRFVWKVLKQNYTVEGLAKSQKVLVGDQYVSIVDYNKAVNKSNEKRTLAQKAEDASATGYDYTEKTLFLPFRFVDSVVGLIFSPF